MTMIATMSLLLVAIRLAVHPSVDSIKSDIGDYDYAKTDVKADTGGNPASSSPSTSTTLTWSLGVACCMARKPPNRVLLG